MNKLLFRQIKKHLGKQYQIPTELVPFFQALSDAYDSFDQDRHLMERSFDLSSEEIGKTNENLRAEIAERSKIQAALYKSRELLAREKENVELARKKAEAANKEKSRFLTNISHEIRTPLNSLIGFSEIISRSEDVDKIHSNAKIIIQESEILLSLINDLLDHSKIESGKLELLENPFSIRELIRSLKTIFSNQIVQKRIQFQTSVPNSVPEYLMGDELRIRQVLMNLIGNAVKFTEKGFVKVSVQLLEKRADHVLIRFCIIDSGIGIPKEKHKLIFQVFSQADNSTTRRYGGSGLGTTIAQRLVNLMGGEISLESDAGKGSTFHFSISLKTSPKRKLPSSSKGKNKKSNTKPSAPKNQFILAVEDYAPNQEILRNHLEREGYSVHVVGSGQMAIESCKKQTYDLILMDLQMPGMDGFETTKTIWKDSLKNTKTPVVALTADASGLTRDTCLEIGMCDVLTKPLRHKILLKKVSEWIKEGSPENKNHSPMNIDKALNETDGDPVFLDFIMNKFLHILPDQIQSMQNALSKNDWETIGQEAHKIQGGAANIFAAPLTEIAKHMQEICKSGNPRQVKSLIRDLKTESKRLKIFYGQKK